MKQQTRCHFVKKKLELFCIAKNQQNHIFTPVFQGPYRCLNLGVKVPKVTNFGILPMTKNGKFG